MARSCDGDDVHVGAFSEFVVWTEGCAGLFVVSVVRLMSGRQGSAVSNVLSSADRWLCCYSQTRQRRQRGLKGISISR